MTEPTDLAIVLTTANGRELSRTIATMLLERRLAACVQVSDIHSYYRWHGAIQEDDEQLLVIKCRADAFAAIDTAIREVHPYDVPEIVQIPITAGSAGYLGWLRDETHVDG